MATNPTMRKLTLLLLLLIPCIGIAESTVRKPVYGTATYYGIRFHNKLTSSGEKYDMNKVSCAVRDRSIPMGTRVRVTNTKTGVSLEMTVKDRMSSRTPHIVDLSYAAFKKLGDIKQGVLKIKMEVID